MFIDDITLVIKAGNGGDGIVHWRKEKFVPKGGPNGGDGGRGGDVYFKGVRNLDILRKYSHNKEFSAGEGGKGGSSLKHGKYGDDCIIEIPIGSVVTNADTKERFEILKEDEVKIVASGGDGGLGNSHFKSSRNTTPTRATKGKAGQSYTFHIEVKILADIGLIGLPNAGKSTFLNVITNSTAKIGHYAFTTKEPNLGVFHKFVFADIPGLIEGASKGKGLGHSFLRHVSRTNVLMHLISLESSDILSDYKIIRNELKQFDKTLSEKKEIILLTKSDISEEDKIKIASELFKTKKVFVITTDDEKSMVSAATKATTLL